MANSLAIPLFRSDASIGKSILSANRIAKIAKERNLESVFVLEDCESSSPLTNIVALHQSIDPIAQLCFGFSFLVGTEEKETQWKMAAFLLRDSGWGSLCQINNSYTRKGFVSEKELRRFDLGDIMIAVPFYESFLFNNAFRYGSKCLPDVMFLRENEALFFIEDHGTIYDGILRGKVESFCNSEGFNMQSVHTVLYEKEDDCLSLQTFRCSQKRTTLEKPNLDRFSHKTFSLPESLSESG